MHLIQKYENGIFPTLEEIDSTSLQERKEFLDYLTALIKKEPGYMLGSMAGMYWEHLRRLG